MSKPSVSDNSKMSASSKTDVAAIAPRSKAEAIRDLNYVIRLCRVHERMFGRFDRHGRLLELMGGSAALVAVFGQSSIAMAIAGVLVAFVAYTNLAFEFGDKARGYRDASRALTAILAAVEEQTLEQIDAARCRVELPGFIEGLRMPCYNDTLRSHGLASYAQPLTSWQRFMAAIA